MEAAAAIHEGMEHDAPLDATRCRSSGRAAAAREMVSLIHWEQLPHPLSLDVGLGHGGAGPLSQAIHGSGVRGEEGTAARGTSAYGWAIAVLLHAYDEALAEQQGRMMGAHAAGCAQAQYGRPAAMQHPHAGPWMGSHAIRQLRQMCGRLGGSSACTPAADLPPSAVGGMHHLLHLDSACAPSGTAKPLDHGQPTPPHPASRPPHAAHGAAGPSHAVLRPAAGRPRRHVATGLLAAGGHDGSWRAVKAVEMYDPRTDTWRSGPSLMQGLSFACGAMLPGGMGSAAAVAGGGESGQGMGGGGGAVFVVGGTPLCSSVWRLRCDGAGSGPGGRSRAAAWEVCPNMGAPRAHAGCAAVAGAWAGGRPGAAGRAYGTRLLHEPAGLYVLADGCGSTLVHVACNPQHVRPSSCRLQVAFW